MIRILFPSILCLVSASAHGQSGRQVFQEIFPVFGYFDEDPIATFSTPNGSLSHDYGEPFECGVNCGAYTQRWRRGDPDFDIVAAVLTDGQATTITLGWGSVTDTTTESAIARDDADLTGPDFAPLELQEIRLEFPVAVEDFTGSFMLGLWQGYAVPEPPTVALALPALSCAGARRRAQT